MPEDLQLLSSGPPVAKVPEKNEKKKRNRDKVRSAWISFVGRIIAQLVGAVATVVLGVMVLQKYSSAETRTDNSASVKRVVEASAAKPREGSSVRVRITAQLVDGETDLPVWAHTYDRPLDDFLPLQAEVATAIAQQVNATVAR